MRRQSDDNSFRACPYSVLKQPVRNFEDTFSAESVIIKKFFFDN
jgi:hypothetical protein